MEPQRERDLELTRYHVSHSRMLVANQRELIERMRRLGWDISETQQTLELFERSLALFEEHLNQVNGQGAGPHMVDSSPANST
jgi:hypothetical protein